MIKNNLQYKLVKNQSNYLNKVIPEYEENVDANKNPLKDVTQLYVFKEQLSELNQELQAYEHKMEFRKYAKEGNDEKVSEMSLSNPLLKNYLTKEQLIRLSNHYETYLTRFVSDVLNKTNEIMKLASNSLEKTLENMGDIDKK